MTMLTMRKSLYSWKSLFVSPSCLTSSSISSALRVMVLHDVKTVNLNSLRCENNYKVSVPPSEQVEGKAQAKAREGNEVPFLTGLGVRAQPDGYTPLRA
jgi:hypothetical protein